MDHPGEERTVETSAKSDGAPLSNGAHAPAPDPPAASADASAGTDDRVARAEQLVDRFSEKVAGFTSRWGRRVLWLGTRIKEEAEDVWAEAQSIRRGDQK
jgi:hypothetical protein